MARNKLVHDADVRADKFVLRLLAQAREFGTIDSQLALLQQGKADCNFDGRRGTQTSAEWNIAADEEIDTAEPLPRPLERPGNPQGVVRPMAFASRGQRIKARLDSFLKVLGIDDELSISAR